MAAMRLGPIHPCFRLPAAARLCWPVAAPTTRPTRPRRRPRTARAAEERVPRRRRPLAPDEVLEAGRTGRTRRRAGGEVFNTGENRFSFGVFHKDGSQVGDAESPSTSRRCPKVNEKVEKPNAKGAERGPRSKPWKNRRRARSRRRSKPSKPSPPSGRRRPATTPTPRRPSTRPKSTSQGRRVADRGADQGRRQAHGDAAAERDRRRLAAMPQVGEKAPLIHTPTPEDVGGDLSKITTRIPPDTQNQVDYADASARNRSSSCLRPLSSARVGFAARSSTWPSRSNSSTETRRPSSTWRSTTTTTRTRGPTRRSAHSTCRPSPGCS